MEKFLAALTEDARAIVNRLDEKRNDALRELMSIPDSEHAKIVAARARFKALDEFLSGLSEDHDISQRRKNPQPEQDGD
jgi:hypothetical protein